jgi:hypothetical protein
MNRKELVQEIISVAAPIFIKKALKYLSLGKSPTEDELSMEVFAECEEIGTDSGSIVNSGFSGENSVQYAGPYGNLVATLCMVVDDLASDIKSQITQELMMKLHVELEQLRGEVRNAKLDLTSAAKYNGLATVKDCVADPTLPYGGIPQFDVTDDDAHLDTIKVGYSSIEQYSTKIPSLADNPLFAMVEKTLERTAAGLSVHSAEDFNAARRTRSDLDTDEKVYKAEKAFYNGIDRADGKVGTSGEVGMGVGGNVANGEGSFKEVSTDVSSNDDLWDNMFKARYGN